MVKKRAKSPPEKKIQAPAVIKSETAMFHDTCNETVRKFAGVQIVSTPFITTKAYRDNYDTIFKKG